jgi:soluble lytic murein transglycosylase
MNRRRWPLTSFLTLAVLTAHSSHALAVDRHKPIRDTKKANQTTKGHETRGAAHHRNAGLKKPENMAHAGDTRRKSAPSAGASEKAPVPPLTGDLALVKNAIDLMRKAKTGEATALEKTIGDPAAQKLVEWFILRHPDSEAEFGRFASFMADNPNWPSMGLLHRRAEARLWQERSDARTVHNFTGDKPASARGRLALARVLVAEGDREGAGRELRAAWRSEELSERVETDALETFRDLLTRDDHRARMDNRIGAKDLSGAMRAAKHLGSDEISIVKACAAAAANASNGLDRLDAVTTEARKDLGYTLCRIHWMLRHDRVDDAARLTLAAAPETMGLQDTDEWWRERRTLARKLLDQGKFQMAYDVVRDAALPANEYYRADFHFTLGWIALRYLNDPAAARGHFAHIDDGATNPIVLARANYWRGRAAEALGENDAMQASYQTAARYTTAYYGQLARAKLGLDRIEPRPLAGPADISATLDERLRAADMLYAIGERDLLLPFANDFAEESADVATLVALGELTGRHNHASAMLQMGKTALARGLAMDQYAFPTIGIPEHKPIAPGIDLSVIYSVARTESAFDQRDKSSANAVGLMQVTPEAGRDTAKRFGVTYDWDKMVSDPVYNTQMGAAELSALLKEYNGNHIMTFAGYNAGRGRVREWVKQRGDPRDPTVDAVDWVERIPLAETRNYVQRVMENLLIYRVLFEHDAPALTKFDQPLGASREANSAPPVPSKPTPAE